MSKQWFVVYCKSREELRAQQNLENQGIPSFFSKNPQAENSARQKNHC